MSTMRPNTHSGFLSLPAELRICIYEFLWQPHLICGASNTRLHLRPSSIPWAQDLNLLLTCRRIYIEARDTAFSRHSFVLTRQSEYYDLSPIVDIPLPQGLILEPHRTGNSDLSTRSEAPAPPLLTLIRTLIIPSWKPFDTRDASPPHHEYKEVKSALRFNSLIQLIHQLPSLQCVTIVLPPNNILTVAPSPENGQLSKRNFLFRMGYLMYNCKSLEDPCDKMEAREIMRTWGIHSFQRVGNFEGNDFMASVCNYEIGVGSDHGDGKTRQCELRFCNVEVG